MSAIPAPIYAADAALLSRVFTTIQTTPGLHDSERLVLVGVLQHMPVPDRAPDTPAPIDRILGLSPAHLKLLAELFTAGLLCARSWGGRPKGPVSGESSQVESTATSTPGTTTPSGTTEDIYRELFDTLSVSPFPAIPAPPSTSTTRHASHTHAAHTRHLSRCPITSRTVALEHAHLLPHSTSTLTRASTPFWCLLALTFGPSLRDTIHATLCTPPSNSLLLDAALHRCFDRGLLQLLPGHATESTLDITLSWRGSTLDLETIATLVPSAPDAQVRTDAHGAHHAVQGAWRQVRDGDVFRLFTNDPVRWPLPAVVLLELHSRLWRMIGSAGLAESAVRKRKRTGTPGGGGRGGRKVRTDVGAEEQKEKEAALKGEASGGDAAVEEGGELPGTGGDAMPWMEAQYLEFKLREVAAGICSRSGSSSEEECDDDEEESSEEDECELMGIGY